MRVNDSNDADSNFKKILRSNSGNNDQFATPHKKLEIQHDDILKTNTPSTMKADGSAQHFFDNSDLMNLKEIFDSKQCLQSRMNLNFVDAVSLRKVSQNFMDSIIDFG